MSQIEKAIKVVQLFLRSRLNITTFQPSVVNLPRLVECVGFYYVLVEGGNITTFSGMYVEYAAGD